MLANMACSLIEHKRINTTVAKAKALKQFVEPLITKSKEDTTHNRRIVFAYLRSKYAVTDLFRDVAAKVGDRPGGYTRIIKVGNRLGDNADMAMIELVDFNELYNGGKKEEKKAKSRRGGKAKGATTAPTAAPTAGEAQSNEAKTAPVAAAPQTVADEPIQQGVVETPAEASIDATQIGDAQVAPEASTEDSVADEQTEQTNEAPDSADDTEEKKDA